MQGADVCSSESFNEDIAAFSKSVSKTTIQPSNIEKYKNPSPHSPFKHFSSIYTASISVTNGCEMFISLKSTPFVFGFRIAEMRLLSRKLNNRTL